MPASSRRYESLKVMNWLKAFKIVELSGKTDMQNKSVKLTESAPYCLIKFIIQEGFDDFASVTCDLLGASIFHAEQNFPSNCNNCIKIDGNNFKFKIKKEHGINEITNPLGFINVQSVKAKSNFTYRISKFYCDILQFSPGFKSMVSVNKNLTKPLSAIHEKLAKAKRLYPSTCRFKIITQERRYN